MFLLADKRRLRTSIKNVTVVLGGIALVYFMCIAGTDSLSEHYSKRIMQQLSWGLQANKDFSAGRSKTCVEKLCFKA